tara:strand:- start:405 stop:1280 length:876 start_codon:yes stop_codon:yes gene_type:complete
MVWQLKAVEALAGDASPDPLVVESYALILSEFLEKAPSDFLEPLLGSPFGRVYKIFLERCCQEKLIGSTSESRRNDLSQKLRQCGCDSPEGWGTLLALFPFFPPQELKVEDAAAKLPSWLHTIYSSRYETLNTQESSTSEVQPSGVPGFEDRIFLNRMLGLSNLYYIDPEDREILQELREVRMQTVQLMLSVGRDELARQFHSDFGDRFWAMAQSGVQKEDLDAKEVSQRNSLQKWLSETPQSLHQEGGIQRFAAVLLFNPPGGVRLSDPDSNLPAWFADGYKRFCSMAQV